jgi:hypothetical protein
MRQNEAAKVLAEYEDEDDLLRKHKPNLGRCEAVLVLRKGRSHRYVPIQEYLKDLMERLPRGEL